MDAIHEFCSGSALFVFNAVDMICGTILLVYSLYLGLNHFAPSWLYGPILCLGVFLLLMTLSSWCGVSNSACTCLLTLSSWLLVIAAIWEVVIAAVIFMEGDKITKFLQEHQKELKITDDELLELENNKFYPAYLLLGLFVMEVLRLCCTKGLKQARKRNQKYYNLKKQVVELDDSPEKEELISSKYKSLKDNFDTKYKVGVAHSHGEIDV